MLLCRATGFFMLKNTSVKLIRIGVIAGLYVALSFFTLPVSGGVMQFRISEGLTLLPLLYLESVPALFVGCLIFNLLSGLPVYDVLFGSLITLFAALFTYFSGKILKNKPLKIIVGGIFPVMLNALILPLLWYWFSELKTMYFISFAFLFISQSVSVYVIGVPLYLCMDKIKLKR